MTTLDAHLGRKQTLPKFDLIELTTDSRMCSACAQSGIRDFSSWTKTASREFRDPNGNKLMNTQKGINRIDYAALEHNQQLRKSAHELRDVSVRAVNDLRVAIIQCRKLEISLDTIHRRLRSNSQSPN